MEVTWTEPAQDDKWCIWLRLRNLPIGYREKAYFCNVLALNHLPVSASHRPTDRGIDGESMGTGRAQETWAFGLGLAVWVEPAMCPGAVEYRQSFDSSCPMGKRGVGRFSYPVGGDGGLN